ncbi:hypothetical protein JCM10207_007506 [Rhodosporidiobolus poonsookiae]
MPPSRLVLLIRQLTDAIRRSQDEDGAQGEEVEVELRDLQHALVERERRSRTPSASPAPTQSRTLNQPSSRSYATAFASPDPAASSASGTSCHKRSRLSQLVEEEDVEFDGDAAGADDARGEGGAGVSEIEGEKQMLGFDDEHSLSSPRQFNEKNSRTRLPLLPLQPRLTSNARAKTPNELKYRPSASLKPQQSTVIASNGHVPASSSASPPPSSLFSFLEPAPTSSSLIPTSPSPLDKDDPLGVAGLFNDESDLSSAAESDDEERPHEQPYPKSNGIVLDNDDSLSELSTSDDGSEDDYAREPRHESDRKDERDFEDAPETDKDEDKELEARGAEEDAALSADDEGDGARKGRRAGKGKARRGPTEEHRARRVLKPEHGLLSPAAPSPAFSFARAIHLLGVPEWQARLGRLAQRFLIHGLDSPSFSSKPARPASSTAASPSSPSATASASTSSRLLIIVDQLSSQLIEDEDEAAFGELKRMCRLFEWRLAVYDIVAKTKAANKDAGKPALADGPTCVEAVREYLINSNPALHISLDAWQRWNAMSKAVIQWFVLGGFPLFLALSVLLSAHSCATSKRHTPFHDIVFKTNTVKELLSGLSNIGDELPFAKVAFETVLTPTLRTLASFGPYRLDILGETGVELDASALGRWDLRPKESPVYIQTRNSPPSPRFATLVRQAISVALTPAISPLLSLFGRTMDDELPTLSTSTSLDQLMKTTVDVPLRILPDRPSELLISLSSFGDQLPVFSSALSHYTDSIVDRVRTSYFGSNGEKVVIVPISDKVDLSPLIPDSDELPEEKQARARTAARSLPTTYVRTGEEDPTSARGYEELSPKERSQLHGAADEATTKRGLLRRFEDAAGGAQQFGEHLEKAFKKPRRFFSGNALAKEVAGGWAAGQEVARIDVTDAIVMVVHTPTDDPDNETETPTDTTDTSSPSPVLIAFPPDTIPPELQRLYENSSEILYPSSLSHNLGIICSDPTCASCPRTASSETASSTSPPLVKPTLVPSSTKLSVIAKRYGCKTTDLEEIERGSSGGKASVKLVRLAPHLRRREVIAWDLVNWAGTKYGSSARTVDPVTRLAARGGAGKGRGGTWVQEVLGETLGPIALLWYARVQPVMRLQGELEYQKLRAGLDAFDGDGDGFPFHPQPWNASHPNKGVVANLAAHVDADRLNALASLAIFGRFSGGAVRFPELLLEVAPDGGRIVNFGPAGSIHGVGRVDEGVRHTLDLSQGVGFEPEQRDEEEEEMDEDP